MRQFQDWLCAELEATDGTGRFREDAWQHHSGGGGRSRVLTEGTIIEKGGVNFSGVEGQMSEQAARVLLMPDPNYFATGVSVVQHPRSPWVPISHMNVRYFEAGNGEAWFGGGLDLTPIYVDEAQARWFHEQIAQVCQQHHPDYYPRFKKWADEYFFIPHRQETRGVGGIFFDRLMVGKEADAESLFAFVRAVAEVYGRTYTALMRHNAARPYSARREAMAAGAPGPLRRVQPGHRPGHPLRPRNRGPHREHSDEFAAPVRVALQPAARSRLARSRHPAVAASRYRLACPARHR